MKTSDIAVLLRVLEMGLESYERVRAFAATKGADDEQLALLDRQYAGRIQERKDDAARVD